MATANLGGTEVHSLLTARDAAFRAGYVTALRSARSALSKGIKAAKGTYCRVNPGTSLWHRKHQADVAGSPSSDRFQVQAGGQQRWYFSSGQAQQLLCMLWSTKPDNQRQGWSLATIYLASPHHQCSRHTQDLNQGHSTESRGLDNILGCVLRTCAGELADVLTDIFNISLSQAIVPRCFKTSTIIPVSKKSVVSCLNDYRPVALTLIVMKCFERLVKPHITASLPALHDPYQFA